MMRLLLLLVVAPMLLFAKQFGGLGHHFVMLQADGQVYAWGEGNDGQLGNGAYDNAAFPVKMLGVASATDVAAGKWFTCIVDTQQVKCTGSGTFLGRDTHANINQLALVERIASLPVEQVFTAEYHTCALTTTGGVWCWSVNDYGQLGIGAPSSWVYYPTPMLGFENSGVADISVGSGMHTCLLTVQGKVFCAGADFYGQLGDGIEVTRGVMQEIVGFKDTDTFRSVSCGYGHTCAVHTNDKLYCWGFGLYGQLAKQLPMYVYDVLKPELVAAVTMPVQSVWCGHHNTFVLTKSNKQVLVFGRNQYGQLGVGTKNNTWFNPTAGFGARANIKEVRGGGFVTCILLESGNTYCAGDGAKGGLGNGQNNEALNPVQVVGIPATNSPTRAPTRLPTLLPTTVNPTRLPTLLPSTLRPTRLPTLLPSHSLTPHPTSLPTALPTHSPTILPTSTAPTKPSKKPSFAPSVKPTREPTMKPTKKPTAQPTTKPTKKPTAQPTTKPTRSPTLAPTKKPSKEPTVKPSKRPTSHPTTKPSKSPSPAPTKKPSKPTTFKPSKSPTPAPTKKPTKEPTAKPTKKTA